MGARASLQKTITVRGDTTGGNVQILQDPDGWLDCGNWADVFVTAKVDFVEAASGEAPDIYLMTLDEKRTAFALEGPPDGPLVAVKGFSGVVTGGWYKHLATLEYATKGVDENPVERWLFWAVACDKVTTGGAFQVTFSIDVTLKRPA